jgi:hypothetical protein
VPNDDNANKCVRCGYVFRQAAVSRPPVTVPNYLVQAILVTIFCCWPVGIPAIVFAAQVNSKALAGDVDGALETSRKAKMWSWIAFGAGLAWVFIWGGIYGLAFLGATLANL